MKSCLLLVLVLTGCSTLSEWKQFLQERKVNPVWANYRSFEPFPNWEAEIQPKLKLARNLELVALK